MLSREQLLDCGYNADAIQHRLERGRIFVVYPGVYALGSPDLTQHGKWMAAVLACGEGAALSDESGLQLFGIRPSNGGPIHVSTPLSRSRSSEGIVLHRRDFS